jgi:hypothetical protein
MSNRGKWGTRSHIPKVTQLVKGTLEVKFSSVTHCVGGVSGEGCVEGFLLSGSGAGKVKYMDLVSLPIPTASTGRQWGACMSPRSIWDWNNKTKSGEMGWGTTNHKGSQSLLEGNPMPLHPQTLSTHNAEATFNLSVNPQVLPSSQPIDRTVYKDVLSI